MIVACLQPRSHASPPTPHAACARASGRRPSRAPSRPRSPCVAIALLGGRVVERAWAAQCRSMQRVRGDARWDLGVCHAVTDSCAARLRTMRTPSTQTRSPVHAFDADRWRRGRSAQRCTRRFVCRPVSCCVLYSSIQDECAGRRAKLFLHAERLEACRVAARVVRVP